MVKTKGSKDKIKRKYAASFARQYLADHNVQVFNGEEQILTPLKEKLYPIILPNTRYYVGEIFGEPGDIKKVYSFEELRDMGFVIISNRVTTKTRWDSGQVVKYEIRKRDETGEHLNKIPKDHYVEYDAYNQALRLMGPRSGPNGFGSWYSFKKKKSNNPNGRGMNIRSYTKNADLIMERMRSKLLGLEDKPTPVYIKEAAFMVTDANEIVCFPNTDDMPSILITGLKGSGKCILQEDKNDYLIDELGRWKQIRDGPKELLVLNKDFKLEKAKVLKTHSRDAHEVLVIETAHSRKVKVTPDHLLLTVTGWVPAGKLKIKDHIAVPRIHDLGLTRKVHRYKVALLAYMSALGSLYDGHVWMRFFNTNSNCIDHFKKVLEKFDPELVCDGFRVLSPDPHFNTLQIWMEKLGLWGKRTNQVFIPDYVMTLCNKQIKYFLSCYFSMKGNISRSVRAIEFPTCSEIIARQIQHLLLRLSINASLRKDVKNIKARVHKGKKHKAFKKTIYLVGISNTTDLKKIIPELLKQSKDRKNLLLQDLYKRVKESEKKCKGSRSSHDLVPKPFWEVVHKPKNWKTVELVLGYGLKHKQKKGFDYSVTRKTIQKIIVATNDDVHKKYAESELLWDSIKSIRKKSGDFKVWDVEIDHPSHNFVTNDVVVHNSFCIHSLVDRFFWKPEYDYKICILNDSSRETGTWCKPNDDNEQIRILRRLNERPLPLPCVYLHPMVNEDYEKLYMGNVGFDITIPFKDIVENHKDYFDLKGSERYFVKIKKDLLRCKREDQAERVFDEMIIHHNVPPLTANKIKAEFESLFDSKMTDISNLGQSPWWTSKNPDKRYNSFAACVHAGVLPILSTEYVSGRRNLLSIYFRHYAGDLFERQKQDPDFSREQSELMIVVDEAHNISQKSFKSGADMLLRRCVREGRPRRIGTIIGTQRFGELPDVIKDNSTHLIVFKNPGEATKIAGQYNMGKHIANTIKDLDKHQCLAYTTEHFIVYDTNGRKRRSRLNEVFIGKTLPPYSLHKKPKVGR